MKRLIGKFEPQDIIREATEVSVNKKDLMASLNHLDSLYSLASLKDEARFRFLRIVVTKIPELATLAMYRVASSYEELKKAIADFDSS